MDNEKQSFELKLENAKKTLEKLMNPEITLEDSVKEYEAGMKELSEAQKMLEDAADKDPRDQKQIMKAAVLQLSSQGLSSTKLLNYIRIANKKGVKLLYWVNIY